MFLRNIFRQSTIPNNAISCGRNFFLADYGARVQAANDTTITLDESSAWYLQVGMRRYGRL